MSTAKEIAKKMGISDEAMSGPLAPFFENPVFTGMMETAVANQIQGREAAEADYKKIMDWWQDEGTGAIKAAQLETANARGEAAGALARLKALQDVGLAKMAGDDADPAKAAAAALASGTDMSKYMTVDKLPEYEKQ